MEEAEVDSDLENQDSREDAPGSLAASIAVCQLASTTQLTTFHTSQGPESEPPAAHQQQDVEDSEGMGDIPMGGLLEDAKFYQDMAFEYQSANEALCLQQEELQSRYTQQAQLIEEASGALRAAETESSQRYQEIVNLQKKWVADIQHAINKVVAQYQLQLSAAKSSLQQKECSIQMPQDQVHLLEQLLASQASLPSVELTSSEAGLCEEVFNIFPGTVNQCRGAAQYHSQDQPFSFHKQVRFEDNASSPDLRPKADPKTSSSQPVSGKLPTLPNLHSHPQTFTPFSATRTLPHNRTFDVSQIAHLSGNAQDAVTIAAEVSAAAAVQASNEFHHMHKPKITKFKGGYSADTELSFHSWCEFQLDLCGGKIEYQDLLKHLSIAFQGGDGEANIMAEFYSHSQCAKESEEAFADELQLLARKVINKKPDF